MALTIVGPNMDSIIGGLDYEYILEHIMGLPVVENGLDALKLSEYMLTTSHCSKGTPIQR